MRCKQIFISHTTNDNNNKKYKINFKRKKQETKQNIDEKDKW